MSAFALSVFFKILVIGEIMFDLKIPHYNKAYRLHKSDSFA